MSPGSSLISSFSALNLLHLPLAPFPFHESIKNMGSFKDNSICFGPIRKSQNFLHSEERISMCRMKKFRTSMNIRGTSEYDVTLADSSILFERNSAPLIQALKSTAAEDVACFHFPGHNRGKSAPSILSNLIGRETFLHDLPELPELDDLFSPKGAILDGQTQAAKLFGALETWFLVGGTTCGIQASVMATCSPGDTLILPRNSHICANSALVLTGAEPKYIMPEYNSEWDIAGGVTPVQVEIAIKELKQIGKTAAAVLVTSPTYHGICSNLDEITKLCHLQGIPVIVDEAHGAHFQFHPNFPRTALEHGADLVVQSTHKVLSSLTQSSMLHMSGNLINRERLCKCLQMLQSSSPSYLLLASLDATRAQLGENPDTIFCDAMDLSLEARQELRKIPNVSLLDTSIFISDFPDIDPLRITLGVSELHISGYLADEILWERHRIIPELVGGQSLTFAINLGTSKRDIQRLILGVKDLHNNFLEGNNSGSDICALTTYSCMQLSPRDAFFANKERLNIRDSIGRICGELICPYPPGIPVLIPGEVITEGALSYLSSVMRMGAEISGASDHQLSSILVCSV